MGAEESNLDPTSVYISDRMLAWVIHDVLDSSPWFFGAEWFYRLQDLGWVKGVRRAVPGELLPHRKTIRRADGTELVLDVTEQARSWYRARQTLEKLRGSA